MRCQSCGIDIISGENFCPNCGAAVLEMSKDTDARLPLLAIKPRFLSFSMLFKLLGWQLLFTIWGGVIFGIFGFLLIDSFQWGFTAWWFALIAGALFFFITPVVYLFIRLNKYTNTEFIFYDNKLEYSEGFFNREKKTLTYIDIIEINLQRDMLQRMSQLGNIIIATQAIGERDGIAKSGVTLFDVDNPDAVFNQVKYIIKEKTHKY